MKFKDIAKQKCQFCDDKSCMNMEFYVYLCPKHGLEMIEKMKTPEGVDITFTKQKLSSIKKVNNLKPSLWNRIKVWMMKK